MAIVHIGIGSNLGNREAHCMSAVERLKEKGFAVKRVSSFYETKPWGVVDQPDFINMAVEAETSLLADEVLTALKGIEREMGREATVKWGPRLIDLDILFYNDEVINREHLRVPHPLMQERDFVLLPLAEIAPDKVHPVLKKTVKQLKEELQNG
ncbi:MAG: 2-amino-4-hydroxy-6-hydroxymethyldihydropteridine diphosphokinase [Nitrospirota bacterium]